MNPVHVDIPWQDNTAPAINQTNLGQINNELATYDSRIVTFDTTKANQSDLLKAFKDVSLNTTTGVITFTLFDNTTKTIDTLLEKVAINFDYDDNPSSAHYQNLIIELEDGTYKYIDMSALITEYEFTDSSTIDFTVTSGAVSASVIDGSITATKCDPTFALAISDAEANGLKSEGYANGTQNGTPVTSGSPYYENNAKYWKEQAQAIASQTLSGLTDVSIQSPQDGEALIYDAANSEWVNGKSGILPHVIVISDTGSTVTLTKGLKVISATETSTGHFEADVDEYGTYTIDSVLGGYDAQASLVVDAVKIYTVDDTHFYAYITVAYNTDGTCSLSATGQSPMYATSSPYTFTVHSAATYTITTVVNGVTVTESVVITTNGQTESFDLFFGKTFATATDAEIASMVALADAGKIDLYDDCGWRVGQEHQISLAAISSSGTYDGISWTVDESNAAQSITLVLMHKGLYELVTPVLDKQGQTRTTCSFIVGTKNSLADGGYMNATDTNSGSWPATARRNWCNAGFRQALPSDIRGCFKKFNCITGSCGGSNVTSQDYFALAAEKEVFGSRTASTTAEADALTQFTWYETASSRLKEIDSTGEAGYFHERSPHYNITTAFCGCNRLGNPSGGGATVMGWLSPIGCV